MESFVYFIRRADGEGPVKIGSSRGPSRRLLALSTWAPYPLAIAATIPGGLTLERRFHAMFAASHSHREWFRPSALLSSVIAAINDGRFDTANLPEPKSVHPPRYRAWSDYSKLAASMGARLAHLRSKGVSIPKDIEARAFRYNAGPYFRDYDPHREDDAEAVQAFLALHGYEPWPVPARNASPEALAA